MAVIALPSLVFELQLSVELALHFGEPVQHVPRELTLIDEHFLVALDDFQLTLQLGVRLVLRQLADEPRIALRQTLADDCERLIKGIQIAFRRALLDA